MAALSAVSCSKELQEGTVPSDGNGAGKIELRIPVDEATKTVFGDGGYEVKWEENDQIGIFVGTSANVEASLNRIGGKAYFTAKVDADAAGKELYAYYPYDANAGKTPGKVTLKIPYQQKQSAPDVFNGSYNPMAAVPSVLNGTKTEDAITAEPLKFRHMGAILEFDVTNVPAEETLKSVQFVAQTGYPATDNSSYNLTSVTEDGDIAAVPGTYYKSVTVALSDIQPGQSSKVYMTLIPGTYSGNIYISTDKNIYRYVLIDQLVTTRAEVKTIKADLSSSRADNGKEIKSPLDYEAFANAANAGDYSAWVDIDGEVKLGANIESNTYFTRIQKDWDGTFNGQNYTMTQNDSRVPLFTVINAGAYVKNIILKGNTTSMTYPGICGNAAVAQVNYGTIDGVTNEMTTDVKVTSGTAIAGIVVCNGGTMRNCTQAGNITVKAAISAPTTLYAGGVAAFASDANEAVNSKSAGKFENCINKAEINISRTSSVTASLQKFAVGGICAVVHMGTADNYSTFVGCENSGAISIIDKDKNVKDQAAAVGGIVGRIANYTASIALNVANEGYYAKLDNCSNSAAIENSFYGTGGVISSNSGARVGATGGIVGYASGRKAKPVDIIECTNTGALKGGYCNVCILGGICGQTNYVNIDKATVETEFGDSSNDEHALAAAGGFVGSSLNILSVTNSSVSMYGTLSPSPTGIGVLQGYVRTGSATYSNIQVKASVSYGSGKSLMNIESDADLSKEKYYVVKAGTDKDPITATASGITYWK